MASSVFSQSLGIRDQPVWVYVAASLATVPFLLVILYLYVTPNSLKDSRRRHLPPGPRGYPLIGSMLDLANPEAVRGKVVAWNKKYGDIFYTKIGGTDYIWLGTPKMVKELLDKKSSVYSSRPPAPLAQDVASAGRRQLFMEYGPRYRVVRKISHALLNINKTVSYQPVQDFESKQLMYDIMHDPEHFYDHNRRYSASVIITITYGHRIKDWDDPLVKRIYTVINNLQNFSTPGVWLVDSFPVLQYLPQWLLGNWRDYGRKCFEHDSAHYLKLWENLKQEVREGKAANCFCKDFFEGNPEKDGLDNLQAAYQAGGLVEAGSETTSAFLNSWILYMTLHPEIFKKAQEEIDRVIGPDRLPNFDDEFNLPYVRALIKETLRTRPPNKIGMQHATTEDDWYEGHFIPKGSVVMLNWWVINFDEKRFEDPYEFKPERYLGYDLPAASYINIADPEDRDHWSYGASRRICPGVHVAEKSLFLNISRLLWAFNIKKKEGVEPNEGMVAGWMTIPSPFECDIKVRSQKHADIITKEWKAAEKVGKAIW